MRLVILSALLLSWSELIFAGGGACRFKKSDLEQLPKFSRQAVYDDNSFFIYHNIVYRLDNFKPDGPIPKTHKNIFERIKKNKNSEITDEDVQLHNKKLEDFLSNFGNVVGVLED